MIINIFPQSELINYVNTERHECRICHAVLSCTRIALTHVAKQHGFADRWIKDQEKLAKIRRANNVSVSPINESGSPATSSAGRCQGVEARMVRYFSLH